MEGALLGYGFGVTDCDRDGNLDVLAFGAPVTANQSKSVIILRGNGDGTFVPGQTYPLDTPQWAGYAIVLADLNHDQISDVIVMIPLSDVTTSPEQKLFRVITRLGLGDCTLGPEMGLDAGAGVIAVAVGDLDGDEIPDLAVSGIGRISTFTGKGDGSFSNRQDFAVGGSPGAMVVTDWNSDGIADVAASDGYLHLLLGTGDGHFAPAIDCALLVSPLVVADFDGDGVVDLASRGTVLLGMHECNFTKQVALVEGQYPGPMAAGDFNGDGNLDVALDGGSTGIGFAPGDGHGNFGPIVGFGDWGSAPVVQGSAAMVPGDFNGDGRLDLIATGGVQASTLINTCQ